MIVVSPQPIVLLQSLVSRTTPSRPAEAVLTSTNASLIPVVRWPFSEPLLSYGVLSCRLNSQTPSKNPWSYFIPVYFYLHSITSRPLTAISLLTLSNTLEVALRAPEPHATLVRNGSILARAPSRTQSKVLAFLSHLEKITIIFKADDIRNKCS